MLLPPRLSRFAGEIRFPTAAELAKSRQLFFERKGMPNCVAAIDGTHVPWTYVRACPLRRAACLPAVSISPWAGSVSVPCFFPFVVPGPLQQRRSSTTTTRAGTPSSCTLSLTTSTVAWWGLWLAVGVVCVRRETSPVHAYHNLFPFDTSPCVASFLIWDAHVGWQGSGGDSTVFKNTEFWKTVTGLLPSLLHPDDYVVGDQGTLVLHATDLLTSLS